MKSCSASRLFGFLFFPPQSKLTKTSLASEIERCQVSWNAPASEFKEALEALSNLEEIEVTKHQWTDDAGFDFYRWMVRLSRDHK